MEKRHLKNNVRIGLLAVAVAALAACGGGGGGGGGAGSSAGAPELQPAQPRSAATTPTESGQASTQQPGAVAGTAESAGTVSGGATLTRPVGYQPVANTPVDVIVAHAGHEQLMTQVQASPGLAPQAAFTREWFVSPTGNDSGDGSRNAPFKTLAKGIQAVGPGEVLRVQGGTYAESVVLAGKDGTATAKITIQGEGKPKLTGDGSKAAVTFRAKHWVLDGFEIDMLNRAVFAVMFDGNNEGSTLANSEVKNGTAGAGVNVHTNSNGAIIENNNIHHFSRGSDDSHGVVVQTTTHDTVVRNNDIHDVSGDSVQCLGPEGFNSNPPADGLLVEGNHFYAAQENGVDVKTCHNVTIRNNRMHTFRPATATQGAKGDAIVIHYSAKNVLVEGNDIYDSGKGIALGGNRVGPMPAGVVIRRNTIHDIKKSDAMEGAGMRIENSEGAVVVNNVFWNLEGYGVILGHGTGGATSNLTLKNNVLGGTGAALKVGGQAPGLKSDANLFGTVATILFNGTSTTLPQWQQAGHDAASFTGTPGYSPGSYVPSVAAIDKGQNVGLSFCGAAPDVGAIETGC